MNTSATRKYSSPAREQKAAATRNRIIDAAETLLLEKGFDGMTVAEVARLAGVSPQTVYAVFASKAGIIMAAIEDRVLRDDRNADAIKQTQESSDPVLMLRGVARIVRNIYEGNAPTFAAVYGAGMVSPQLAEVEKAISELRREKQAPLVDNLYGTGKLLPHLDKESVRDILWTLTSREMYHLLVIRRGWTPGQYEEQLATMLVTVLVGPETIPGCSRD